MLRTAGAGHCQAGTSVVELIAVLALIAILAASGLALAGQWRSRSHAEGGARLIVHQVRLARALAIRERRQVGLAFESQGDDLVFRLYSDGNANGVRRADIARGADRAMGDVIRLGDWYPGTSIRVPVELPAIDDGPALAAGSEAVRLAGNSTILSCAPTGTTTAGTVYVAGPSNEVFAVRVLGTTGRLRLLEFRRSSGDWVETW